MTVKQYAPMSAEAKSKVVSVLKSGVGSVVLGFGVAFVFIGYLSIVSKMRASENMQHIVSKPLFELTVSASMAALIAAAFDTMLVDRLLVSRQISGVAPKMAVRFIVFTLSYALVMYLTTFLSGRLTDQYECGRQSYLKAKLCKAAVKKANAEVDAALVEAGEKPLEQPAVTAADGGASSPAEMPKQSAESDAGGEEAK